MSYNDYDVFVKVSTEVCFSVLTRLRDSEAVLTTHSRTSSEEARIGRCDAVC